MFPTKTLLTISTLLSLPFGAAAQFTINPGLINPGIIITPSTPPTLPSSESRFGSYDKSIGNTWLGGDVHAYAGMVRQKSGTYELANEHLEFYAGGTLLKHSLEVAEINGDATNILKNGVQTRSGTILFDFLGKNVINKSFTGSYTFPAPTSSSFSLFSTDVDGDVPLVSIPLIGPISVNVDGNAGCGYGRNVTWTMPSGKTDVVLAANASLYAFADAWVGIGISGVASAGVGIYGKVLQQTLSGTATSSAVYGLSGGAAYTLNPISISLYVFGQVFGKKYTNTVTSWSAGTVSQKLM